MKRQTILEGHDYVTSKSFQLTFGDEKPRQFGVHFETINMLDATGEDEFKDYPYLVSAGIVLDKCHQSFDESDGPIGKATKLGLIYDTVSYMGSVPVDHILTHQVLSSAENKLESNFETLAAQFSAREAMVKTNSHDFGTIAAQQGKGTKFSYLQFKTAEAAERYIDYLILHRLGALSMMIGFILDRPINMAGDSGWNTLEMMAKGK